jgi:1-acyl-sn-glycerol-3-phosphate acyltransferase
MRDIFRAIWRLSVFLSLILLFTPLQLLLLWAWPRHSFILPLLFHRLMGRVLHLTLTQEGTPVKALLVSNHLSWLDILVLGRITKLCFIAKSEVATWPLFGQLAKLQRTIFVERHNRQKVIDSLNMIKTRLDESPIVLFAEGTTSDGTKVLPFISSLIFAPAQPVTLCYDDPQNIAWHGEMTLLPHFWAVFKRKETRVNVIFHAPLMQGNRKEIALAAEHIIRETYAMRALLFT